MLRKRKNIFDYITKRKYIEKKKKNELTINV